MQVKVCGITQVEQMIQLDQIGIDYCGMIFYPGSKRCVPEDLYQRSAEIKALPIRKIGVFVNQDYETILNAIDLFGLYGVQLHGDETDEFCLELMDKVKVIKVFRIGNELNIDELLLPFIEVCHHFLFDTATKEYGGSGKKFNWDILRSAKINKPFFLSGGIAVEDVESIQSIQHPCLHAVDINSCFEKAPGVKDLDKVKSFIEKLGHE
jgi:phosphoribosylanthranilate isomerase